jgi:hypothetical protein
MTALRTKPDTGTAQMTPNEIAEAARRMIVGRPDLERDMRAAWDRVQDVISINVDADADIRWKAYGKANKNRAARLAMLTAFVDGKPVDECATAALAAVGLDKDGNP